MSGFARAWLRTYIFIVLVYAVVHAGNVPLLGGLGTVLAVLLVVMIVTNSLRRLKGRVPADIRIPFLVSMGLLSALVLKLVIMGHLSHLGLAAKIALYHIFFVAGLFCAASECRRLEPQSSYVLGVFALPVVLFVALNALLPSSDYINFYERNSFAGYILAVSPLLHGVLVGGHGMRQATILGVMFLTLLIVGTLGALLAYAAAYILQRPSRVRAVASKAAPSFFVFAFSVAVVALVVDFRSVSAFDKLFFNYDLFKNLIVGYDGNILDLTMGAAVSFAPSDDLQMSGIFRIIHWLDILNTFFRSGPLTILLGGGTGWVDDNRHRFVYNLHAHNEYIRVAAEQGLIWSGLAISSLLYCAFSIRRHSAFVPLFAVLLFFGSDNLLNNFVSSAFFFFMLAYVTGLKRPQAATSISTDFGTSKQNLTEPKAHARFAD